MRTIRAAIAGMLCLALFSCSHAQAPAGRWEGVYESNDTMVAARLEIGADGMVRLSAPDATDIAPATPDERAAMRDRLAQGLATAWPDAVPRTLDFDGTIFRKPGGVAPQIEWDPAGNTMTLDVYLGTQPAIHIPLHAVKDFSDDPWPHPAAG
jgi:hypothetical protein